MRRESAGFWCGWLYLPESKPPASGLHTGRPTFSDSSMGTIPPFEIAAGDRIISLKRVESGQVRELGDAEAFGGLPCLPVGAADVADLSLLHQGVESAGRLFDRVTESLRVALRTSEALTLRTATVGGRPALPRCDPAG